MESEEACLKILFSSVHFIFQSRKLFQKADQKAADLIISMCTHPVPKILVTKSVMNRNEAASPQCHSTAWLVSTLWPFDISARGFFWDKINYLPYALLKSPAVKVCGLHFQTWVWCFFFLIWYNLFCFIKSLIILSFPGELTKVNTLWFSLCHVNVEDACLEIWVGEEGIMVNNWAT